MARIPVPHALRAIADLGFDFSEDRLAGKEAYADCVFCGAKNKCYGNMDTGLWSCKVCGLGGNTLTFIREWYNKYQKENGTHKTAWKLLANDRQIAPDALLAAGLVYDGNKYYIPSFNTQNQVVNLAAYEIPKPGAKKNNVIMLSGLEAPLWGLEVLPGGGAGIETVYLCEGYFDSIALRTLIDEEGVEAVVLGVPGCGTWKAAWTEYVTDKNLIVCYDNDTAAVKGKARVYQNVRYKTKTFRHIDWPVGLPDGYDIRDFVTSESTLEELQELVKPYITESDKEELKPETTALVPISSSARPTWEQTVAVYRRLLHMTPDLEDALRISFAVALTATFSGPPLWMHLVAPAGATKTTLLLSLSSCEGSYFVSTLTPSSLISGFRSGGSDPSLLPKINHKTLIIKDFTEILSMPKINKDDILGTLRGAYDGEASKPFGNIGTVTYKSSFNVLSGVTPQIYATRTASLGERFLMFHIVKGVDFNAKETIRAAIRNVGKDNNIKSELADAARLFLEVNVTEKDAPSIPEEYEDRIIALSELVAILRASVERDFRGENLLFRPQQEMGTRVASQFSKLMIGIGLTYKKPVVDAEAYRICTRVGLDSVVGFNLEVIASLFEKPRQTVIEIAEDCQLPKATLRSQLDDLVELRAVAIQKVHQPEPGQPAYRYSLSDRVKQLWIDAHLERVNGEVRNIAEQKAKIKIKRARTITRKMRQKP